VVLLLAAGCGPKRGDDDDDAGGDGDADSDADGDADVVAWTIFVYGHADHNLSYSLVTDVLEMGEAELGDDLRVIVMADWDASREAGSEETFPAGTEWMRVVGGGQAPESLEVQEEQDLDDPDVLTAAVARAFGDHPARRYGLVLWDHGGAWKVGFGGDTQNGTRDGTPLPATAVAQAVREGLAEAGLESEPPLDFFAFDTCLMAGAEVLVEFRDVAGIYIANAELDYGDGWDYQATLTWIAEHPDAPIAELGATEAEQWDRHHVGATINDSLLRSHVALDLTRADAFLSAWADFVSAWLGTGGLSDVELGRAAFFSLPPYSLGVDDVEPTPELRDAAQFLGAMAATVQDDGLSNAASDAEAALGEMVLGSSQGELRSSTGQLGVHVALPLPVAITEDLLDEYVAKAPTWTGATAWDAALLVLQALNDGEGPMIDAVLTNGWDPDPLHQPTISFETPDDDAATASVDLAELWPEDDLLVYLGIVGKGAIESGFSYDFTWDGGVTTLPDGAGDLQSIMVTTWMDLGASLDDQGQPPPLLATFGLLTDGGGVETLSALLFQDGDAETGLAVLLESSITLLLDEVASDFPGTTFTPLYLAETLSTGEQEVLTGFPIPIDGPTLPLERASAPPGTYGLITTSTDVFGNESTDVQRVDVLESFGG
jgi:hypothetical protein